MHLRATDLSKSFQDASGSTVVALEGVHFEIQQGERVALIGASGSGKTTLLRLFNGTLAPSGGMLCYDGRCMPGLPTSEIRGLRRKIGMIYQQHYLVPSLPVYQNVLAGRLAQWGTAKAIANFIWPRTADLASAERVLAQVGMAEKLHSRTGDLSGGQQQRVAIARALIQDPGVILADEPVASLDPALAEEVLALIITLSESTGKTLVASLHDVALTRQFFRRVIALKRGKLIYDGPPSGLTEAGLAEVYT